MTDIFDGSQLISFQDEGGDWLAHLVEIPGFPAFADTLA